MSYNQGVADSNKLRAKHGRASRKKGSNIKDKAYNTWRCIKYRCTNPNSSHYARYGGRGISICPEWASDFSRFIHDVGDPPSAMHTLDRIDNNGNYEPSNVRWATRKEQANNRSTNVYYEKDGLRMNMTEWAEYLGVPLTVLASRFRRGLPVSEVLRPRINSKRGEYVEYNGKKMTLREWAAETGIKYQTLWYRNSKGLPLF